MADGVHWTPYDRSIVDGYPDSQNVATCDPDTCQMRRVSSVGRDSHEQVRCGALDSLEHGLEKQDMGTDREVETRRHEVDMLLLYR